MVNSLAAGVNGLGAVVGEGDIWVAMSGGAVDGVSGKEYTSPNLSALMMVVLSVVMVMAQGLLGMILSFFSFRTPFCTREPYR
jgi:hypothetical protein